MDGGKEGLSKRGIKEVTPHERKREGGTLGVLR
jgi:hypothetical protein